MASLTSKIQYLVMRIIYIYIAYNTNLAKPYTDCVNLMLPLGKILFINIMCQDTKVHIYLTITMVEIHIMLM